MGKVQSLLELLENVCTAFTLVAHQQMRGSGSGTDLPQIPTPAPSHPVER